MGNQQSHDERLSSGTLDEQLGFETHKRTKKRLACTDDDFQSLEIDHQDEDLLSRSVIIDRSMTYGKGSFGVVHKAINIHTGMEYAVKIIDKRRLDEENLDLISKESAITSGLDHPNIIKTYFVTENKCTIKIFMDLVLGGELFDYLNKFDKLNECRSYLLFKQMVDAVEYLHERYIVHHDIKIENMLINNEKDLHLYLIDFGFSFIMMPDDPLSENYAGSSLYASPEIHNGIPSEEIGRAHV